MHLFQILKSAPRKSWYKHLKSEVQALTYHVHLLKHGSPEHVGHVLLLKGLKGLANARTKIAHTIPHLHLPRFVDD